MWFEFIRDNTLWLGLLLGKEERKWTERALLIRSTFLTVTSNDKWHINPSTHPMILYISRFFLLTGSTVTKHWQQSNDRVTATHCVCVCVDIERKPTMGLCFMFYEHMWDINFKVSNIEGLSCWLTQYDENTQNMMHLVQFIRMFLPTLQVNQYT